MENEWSKVKLVDIIQFNPKESIKKGEIAKKVAMEKLEPFTRKISGFEEAKFTSGTKFRNGDTLLARITPCLENGKTAQVDILDKDEIGFGSTEYIVLREKLGITDNDFIYYLSISPEFRNVAIKAMNGSSGRQRVQKDVLENSEFLLPPLDEQKAIAKVLSDLDEKIEINNKINRKLEEMAQAIFKQWFVDFEFPNEYGKPYKSSSGEMVESELGITPKGWKVGSIYEVANVIYGAPFSSKKFNEDKIGLPLIRIRDLKTAKPSFYTEEKHKNATKVKTGDILVGMDAEFTPTIWRGNEGYLNQRVCMFKSNKDYLHDYFIYEIIKPYMNLMEFSKVGTTVIHLGKGDIDNMKIVIPKRDILKLFYKIIDPIYSKLIEVANENRILTDLRDTLLPKLMSGEIRVPID